MGRLRMSGSESTPTFGTLLKSYLLPTGLMTRPCGDAFLVHAMAERNRAVLRRCMPHNARVHCVLALAFLAAACSAGLAEAPTWLLVGAALPAALELGLALVFVCTVLALRLM